MTAKKSRDSVIRITESKLYKTVPDKEINIYGYEFVRLAWHRHRSGVICYIQNNISFSIFLDTFLPKTKLILSKYLFATTKKGTIKEYKKLLYKKQYTHLKVLQLRYSGRDSIIQVRIDLIFIMVPLGEQKQNGGGTDIQNIM